MDVFYVNINGKTCLDVHLCITDATDGQNVPVKKFLFLFSNVQYFSPIT